MRMTRKKVRLALLAAAVPVAMLIFAAWSNAMVEGQARGLIYTDANSIPAERVGVVLGTDLVWRGRMSPYYQNRIDAAARLYHAGKVSRLIVSGYPGQPQAMKTSLMVLGVPEDRITLDPGGYRTLASIIQARDVFGQKSFTVISQADHCARAIYLARAYGCEAIGYAAEDPRFAWSILREFFARPKAVLDVWLLHRNAAATGPRTPIPVDDDPSARRAG
jgi:vancomycin permeability regulator SanA